MHTDQKDKFIQDLIDYAESEPLKEICGFVCYKDDSLFFEPARNHSSDNDSFLISPIDFLQKKLSGELVAIFHSHPLTKENPSDYDIKNSKNCLFPFLIFSLVTEKFHLFDMPHFERQEKGVMKLREVLND